MDKIKVIILHYDNKLHQIPIPMNYRALINATMLNLILNYESNMYFTYNDQDGDKIRIGSDYDYKQAILYMNNTQINQLKVFLETSSMINNSKGKDDNEKDLDLFQSNPQTNIIIKEYGYTKRIAKVFYKLRTIVRTKNFVKKIANVFKKAKKTFERIKMHHYQLNSISSKEVNNTRKNKEITYVYSCNTKEECQMECERKVDHALLIEELNQAVIKSINSHKIIDICNGIQEEIISKLKEDCEHMYMSDNTAASSCAITTIHSNTTCNQCQISPIKGIRYQCTVCPYFNLCFLCEDTIHHPHNFYKIRHNQNTNA